MWRLLARKVLKLRDKIFDKWELKPDLFFYRDPEEQERGALRCWMLLPRLPRRSDDWNEQETQTAGSWGEATVDSKERRRCCYAQRAVYEAVSRWLTTK
ncbi:hypothetical protein quinque_003046 [Culex quinquefasciatus]